MRTRFIKLNKQLRKHFPDADLECVKKAYRFAQEAHQGQERNSGDPYVIHTLEVALILAQIGLDPTTCAAAVLHDVIEDTDITREQIEAEFGEEIAALVDGVTKVSSLSFSDEVLTREEKQAQNIRKMMVATAKEVRVIIIKLADRLHNMRTIEFLPKRKRIRISRETLDIYAPLAHRLGISQWKWELEDHAFHQLHPDEYRATAKQVAMKRREREVQLKEVIEHLESQLAEEEVVARVIGRPKHLYSIYQKMVKQGKDFDQVMDVLGVRIITHTIGGCYNALGVVHSMWTPLPGRLKDYIAMPKMNMYQAIHTTVMRDNGIPLEIQIRSEDMDRTAREGIAAHWTYKEQGTRSDKKLDGQLAWLRQTYEWLKDANAPEELMDSMRADFAESNIYTFTPKGEVQELPSGATPLDFAYLIHSDVGHRCIGAKVNGRMVPLRYHLQTGDVVEILTSKNQNPNLDWVDIVVTGRARTRIRQRLRELGELHPIDDPSPRSREPQRRPTTSPRPAASAGIVRQVDDKTRQSMIRIDGSKGLVVHFAKCCNPMPGHPVIAYATKGPGITVHRADCKSFAKSTRDPTRVYSASWEGDESVEIGVHVEIGARPNVLADITHALRPMNIDIVRAEYHPGENGRAVFEFVFATTEREIFERLARTLRNNVTGVSSIAPMKLGSDDALKRAG